MSPMYGWIRYRRRSRGVNQRFVAETIDALQALHRKVWEIEESLQEQHAANRKLEQQTARAEAEASVARLEFRDILREYAATEKPPDGKREQEHRSEKASLESEQSLELLDNLMPVLPFRRPADPTSDRQADAGLAHLCFVSTPGGYELVELFGAVPTVGNVVDLGEHGRGAVAKVARSPLSNDERRCAYLLPIGAALEEAWTKGEVSESLSLVGSR